MRKNQRVVACMEQIQLNLVKAKNSWEGQAPSSTKIKRIILKILTV